MTNDTLVMIEGLKKEAAINKALNSVMYLFALRKRARGNITLSSLIQKMKREKFEYSKEQLSEVLEIMGKSGLGQVHRDSKGKVKALTGIRVTLQSVGSAVVSKEGQPVSGFRPKAKFTKITVAKRNSPPEPKVTPVATTAIPLAKGYPPRIVLSVLIGTKTWNLSLPDDATPKEISDMVSKFQQHPTI